MIIALLSLIALILLFGASVVKGWIKNAAAVVCASTLIVLAVLWVGSFFGENGFLYVWLGLGTLLFIASIWARCQKF